MNQTSALRIAVLTSVHVGQDTRIYHRQCRALAKAGHDVVLICQTSFESANQRLRVIGVGPAKSRLSRMTATVWRIVRRALAERADVYHLHDPELLPAGLLLRLGGRRVVYDVHEDTPRRIREKSYLPRLIRTVAATSLATLEWIAGRAMTATIAATPRIAARFPPRRCVLVQNFPDAQELSGIDTGNYLSRPPIIAYVGDLAPERGTHEAVAALSYLPPERVTLEMAGGIATPELRRELSQDAPENLRLLGWQDRDEVAMMLSRARAGLAALHPIRAYREAQPLKLFEYMAAGLPIIASDFPEWRDLIGRYDCAVFVDPLSPESIARAIQWILDNPEEARRMGERGRQAVLERFTWEPERQRLLECYHRITQGKKCR